MSDKLSVTGIGIFEAYEKLYLELAPKMQQLEELKGEIKKEVLDIGESVSHGVVKATYKKGYVRVSWDSKKLDGFAAAHPEILPFRGETAVGPSVSVSLAGGKERQNG